MKTFGELLGLKQQLASAAERKAEEQRLAKIAAAKRIREANLFRQEMRDAVVLPASNRYVAGPAFIPPYPFQTEMDERLALDESMSDEIDIESLLETDASLSYRRSQISADVVRKLRRGRWSIKAQLDLHGLRTEEARSALVAFINHCQKNDWRCVRVIHGKGLGSPDKEPVLKGKVLKWLVQRNEVLAFCQARPNDGGSGALIVLLKAG
jgi:DNA-nicking Smr family endonuclease